MITLRYSEGESGLYGIAYFRSIVQHIDWRADELVSAVNACNPSARVIRIKFPAADDRLFVKLAETGYSYSIHSTLLQMEVNILDNTAPYEPESNLSFEKLTPFNFETFTATAIACQAKPTGTWFFDPSLSPYFNSATETAALRQYLQDFLPGNNPNNFACLIFLGGVVIGYVVWKVESDILEGILYGIVPAYRGIGNYAQAIQRYLIAQAKLFGASRFVSHVLIQNSASLRTLLNVGAKPNGAFFNIHIKTAEFI